VGVGAAAVGELDAEAERQADRVLAAFAGDLEGGGASPQLRPG
jgi:hypothetical protein